MRNKVVRGTVYAAGLLILAMGIILNTKTGLGVSPIVSVPYVVAQIMGWNFGDATLVFYALLAVAEYLLKGGRFRAYDLLQIPLSVVFTRVMNLFSACLPDAQGPLPRALCLIAAIVCTGVGAAMTLDMRLVPNPGDGIVQAISDRVGRPLGLCKNLFDLSSIALSLALGLLFEGRVVGIGLGTLAAMLGVGRVMALFQRLLERRLTAAAGLAIRPPVPEKTTLDNP